MSILSPFTGLLRSALGVAQHEGVEAVEHSPLHATVALEEKLDHLARALHRAADAADRQVEVLDGVGRSLPALTDKLTALNEHAVGLNQELDELVKLLTPVADAQRDVSRVERLLRRSRHQDDPHIGEDQP